MRFVAISAAMLVVLACEAPEPGSASRATAPLPAIEPGAAAASPPASPAAPASVEEVPSVGAEPDVVLPIEPGGGRRTIALDVDRACSFARAEVELEIESMPDGTVTLVAPGGARARMPLHVLTTSHFFHTFDWSSLEGLHAARGQGLAGRWTLQLAMHGATYCGGSCEEGASPMPPVTIRSGEIRLWCERASRPASASHVVALGAPSGPRAHVGGALTSLLSVHDACSIATAQVELSGPRSPWRGVRFELVAPDGTTHRLSVWRALGGASEPAITADVAGVAGESSAGLWELRAARADAAMALAGVRLDVQCAPASPVDAR